MPDIVPWPGLHCFSMAISHLCWQLSHLGGGETVFRPAKYGSQDALVREFAPSVAGLASPASFPLHWGEGGLHCSQCGAGAVAGAALAVGEA